MIFLRFFFVFILWISIVLYSSPSLASEANSVVCTYTYQSIRTGETCTYHSIQLVPSLSPQQCDDSWKSIAQSVDYYDFHKDDLPENCNYYYCTEIIYSYCSFIQNGALPSMISSCFHKLSSLNADFVDDIKSSTLEVDFSYYNFSQGEYNYNDSLYQDEISTFGCGGEIFPGDNPDDDNDDSSCNNVFDYLFSKLSTKFPLDIFVPSYNFTAGDTACPEITLFGQDMEFCAVVMVASAVKHIFLIVFIIRAVIHF
ncbi:hypothetical protein [Okeania sp. KiyG1]|uniref:hypothetical protein n=1 Tax=Okeania sp. KiyG1 TaxID=2720165 RepID=UPI001923AE20|nr:hypothetical protein [Okeania sp. KiyG1]GGA14767.1 hypothetical protein CYANOKiyG1_28500 [Okeania sp. KiyG1]